MTTAEPWPPPSGAATAALPPDVIEDVRRASPWWSGRALPPVPAFRRWPFAVLLQRLTRERMLAPILAVRGPRQVGKTTLQLQLIEHLLAEGVAPSRLLRAQFDDLGLSRSARPRLPILDIVRWFEQAVLRRDLNESARAGEPAFIFLDEVQNLPDWSLQLKVLVDQAAVRVVVTGSSALRIALGRDSLAGRIQSLEVGPLRLGELASFRGLGRLSAFEEGNGFGPWARPEFWRDLKAHGEANTALRDAAFSAFSERGGYPVAQRSDAPWPEVAAQLNETVVRRVVRHDLRLGPRGRRRDERLLEEVFRMAARYCGQSPSPSFLAREARDFLEADIGVRRLTAYLDVLEQALLVRLVEPLEMRLQRRRGPAKLCLSDHALRAAWLDEVVPLDPAALARDEGLSDIAGRIAESVVGSTLASLGIPIAHLPPRRGRGEVDFVLTTGDRRIPIEVKYQKRIDPARDIAGLLAFLDRPVNRAEVGIIVTRDAAPETRDPRIVALPLSSLLLVR
jgi:predicted AAA+ superfamily ATPase